jgi:hypothetical protein
LNTASAAIRRFPNDGTADKRTTASGHGASQ